MKNGLLKYVGALALLLPSGAAAAQLPDEAGEKEARKIVSEYSLVLGRTDALSTYLSPLNYSGFTPALRGTWSKGMPFDALRWRMRFEAQIGGGRLLNSPGTALEYNVAARFSWGMERQWRVADHLTFSAGGNVGFNAGVLWLTRNSNNPVSLPLWAGVAATGSVSYDFSFGRLPVTLSERVEVPTLGAFFMPGYGESFYEIYVGNHSGLVHCGWWGNAPGVTSHLQLTLRFRQGALGVGYLLDCRRIDANNLKTRTALNALTISWIR